jgi:hypothetical protein
MSEHFFTDSRDLLHEQSSALTGLTDFGDPAYLQAFNKWLEGFDESGMIDVETGRSALLDQIRLRLDSRLQAQDQLKKNPEISSFDIKAPIFILGLPRSGTTILQHMLSRDEQLQTLQYWLGSRPIPRPARQTWRDYPVFHEVQGTIDSIFEASPQMRSMHYMAADEAEECRLLLEPTFASPCLATYSHLESYQAWLNGQDLTAQYEYYRDLLKLIGLHEPDKTWLLKCPHHSPHLDSLFKVFPDARIILTHRNPLDIIPSTCSLSGAFVRMFEGNNYDPVYWGKRFLSDWDYQLRCLLKARDERPEQFYDFRFAQFGKDPIGSISQVYDHFGLDLDGDTADSLKDWLDANPKGKHGDYDYNAEDFGLTAGMINERFNYYDEY